jgi:TP901 family phage tail tape measure protein
MAKKISSRDLFDQEDIFKGIRDSAEKTLVSLNKINEEFKQTAVTLKQSLSGAKFDSSESIKKFTQATAEANKIQKQSIEIEKLKEQVRQQAIKSEREQEKLAQDRIKTQKAEAQERARLAKESEKAAKNAERETSAYSKMSNQLNELRKRYKDLAVQNKENTAEGKLLLQNITQLDTKLKQVDATVGQHQRNVGNYTGAISTLQDGLAQLGIAFGVGTVITKADQTLKSFDENAADMAKTLNVSTQAARDLSQELLKIDTRTSITGLQQIAKIGGQLGIDAKNIIGFTQSIDKLNVALGDEFQGGAEEITSVVGGLRNVLGDIKTKNVSQDLLNIGNALNVLGAEGSATSPIISDFAGRIGGVGIPLGLTSSQILGLSSTLQELNVSAERGGTAVSGILKKMAENTEGFSKIAGMNAAEFANLVNTDLMGAFMKVIEGTKQFQGNAVGLATALDSLKLDGAGASEVLLKLSTNTDLLTKRTDQAGKALKSTTSITDEFTKKNETLQAKTDKLKNAIDKYILGIDESGNVTGKFGAVLDFLAANLGTIINLAIKAATAWLTYQAALKAVQAYQFIMSGGLREIGQQIAAQIPQTRAYRLEQIQLARAQQQTGVAATQAGSAVSGFGQAFKSIAIVTIIAGVIELAMAWWDVASNAKAAREEQELTAKAQADGAKKAQEYNSKSRQNLDKELNNIQRLRNENKISQAEFLKQKEALLKKTQSSLTTEIELEKKKKTTSDKTIKANEKTIKDYNELIKLEPKLAGEYGKRVDYLKDQNAKLRAGIKGSDAAIKEYNADLSNLGEEVKDATSEIVVNSQAHQKNTKEIKTNVKAKQEMRDLTREIRDEQIKQIEDEKTRRITEVIENAKRRKQDLDKEVTNAKQKAQLKLLIEENMLIEIGQITDEYSQIEYDKEKEAQAKLEDLKNQAIQNEKKRQDELLNEAEAFTEERQRLFMSDQEKEMRDLNDWYFEKKVMFKDNQQALEDIEIIYLNRRNDINLKYQESEIEANQKNQDKLKEDEKEANKQRWESIEEFGQKTTDYFKEQSEQRIAQIDKEIAAAEKQADFYRELAAQGNIDAEQSLAEQQKIIAEGNRKKEQEQRKQQQLEMANTLLQTYSNYAAEDPKTALTKTISDATVLWTFIKSLPMFYDGTEDTGKNGRGVDGKGGFHAILHPNERVIPKSLNDQIGGLTNEELTRIATQYQSGRLIGQDVMHSSLELAVLVNEMKDLKEVIKRKPETNIELGEITQSAMEIVKSTRQGNTIVYNRFKVRK